MEDQLIETWAIHNRINLYFLDAPWRTTHSAHRFRPRAGRFTTCSPIFTNVRLLWLKAALPSCSWGLEKLEEPKPWERKATCSEALQASGRAIEQLLQQSLGRTEERSRDSSRTRSRSSAT